MARLEPVGSGCITGSALVLWDRKGVFTNLRFEFEAFDLIDLRPEDDTRDRSRSRYCEVLVDLKYPERFGLTVTITKMEARTFLVRGVKGTLSARLSTEWQGPGDDFPRPVSWARIEAMGPWYGKFSEDAKLDSESLVLPCGMKRPFVARIVKAFTGKPATNERSFMKVENHQISADVFFKLTWRHCPPGER